MSRGAAKRERKKPLLGLNIILKENYKKKEVKIKSMLENNNNNNNNQEEGRKENEENGIIPETDANRPNTSVYMFV